MYQHIVMPFRLDRKIVFLGILMLFLGYQFKLLLLQQFNETITQLPAGEEAMHLGRIPLKLFIAIGSAPHNFHLRRAARSTYLKMMKESPLFDIDYRFFTDSCIPGSVPRKIKKGTKEKSCTNQYADVNASDLVLMPMSISSGYSNFAGRAFYQQRWIDERYQPEYFLRLDDDGFLCAAHLLAILSNLDFPKRRFFWGKYFCKNGRILADENFLFFSWDIIQTILQMYGAMKLGSDDTTFGALWGLWQHIFDVETVWDDQDRIDSQQDYTTEYMHAKNMKHVSEDQPSQFCQKHVWAHHVTLGKLIYKVHAVSPTNVSQEQVMNPHPNAICHHKQQFDMILDPNYTSLVGGNVNVKMVLVDRDRGPFKNSYQKPP
jgi:hypothetical protein